MPAQRSGINKNDETDGIIITSVEDHDIANTTLSVVKGVNSDSISLLSSPLMGSVDSGNNSSSLVPHTETIKVEGDGSSVSTGETVVVQQATSLLGSLASGIQGGQTIVLKGASATSALSSFGGAGGTIVVQAPGNSADSSKQTIVVDAASAKLRENQMQTAVVEVPANNEKVGLKRQLSSGASNSPIVTKVIITKNPSTSQPQAVPVQMAQVQQGQTVSLQSLSGLSVMQPHLQSPTKTVTITSQGIVSPIKLATLPGSPTRVVPVNKVPISPAKTPTKITMIPVSIAKSPQRLMTVSAGGTVMSRTFTDLANTHTTSTTSAAKPATITMSPSKLIIKQGNGKTNVVAQSMTAKGQPQIAPAQQVFRPMQIQGASNVQQIQVPGSKFHYVRLVSPASQSSTATVSKPTPSVSQVIQTGRAIAPATVSAGSQPSTSQVKITLPVQTTQLMAKSGAATTGTQNVQRILLPAPNTVNTYRSTNSQTSQIRPNVQVSTQGTVQGLGSAATILSTGNNIQGLQGFALVPASYVTQIQKQIQTGQQGQAAPQKLQVPIQQSAMPGQSTTVTAAAQQRDYIPIASSDPSVSASVLARNSLNGTTTLEATGARPRKPCNCTKSQCLKLYCDCFANGEFCHNCNCTNCANNLEHEEERSRAIKSCLDRNPMAFHPKIGKTSKVDGDRRHNKGCNCKRSGCLKNYCECYEAKIMCSSICKCVGCKNFEESPERKTLMHLADAAEVRVQQQTAAKTKLSSQMSGLPSKPPISSVTGERLPYTLITTEVAEATCACLLAQAEEAERMKMPPVVQERMVIEEFGRCLMQIIESANKTRAAQESLP